MAHRLRRIAAHLPGGLGADSDRPEWVQVMDGTRLPMPRGGGCRCSAEKWRYVCRCYPCLEHAGREGEFEWTTELLPAHASSSASSPVRALLLAQQPASSGGKDQKRDRMASASGDPVPEDMAGVTRYTSVDGRVIGPLAAGAHPRFIGIPTFCRLPLLEDLPVLKEARRGNLRVKVLAAYGLLNRDTGLFGDVSDPFVVGRIGGQERKTRTINDNLNPVWRDEPELKFEVHEHDATLQLEVVNENILINSTLGTANVGLWVLPCGRWLRRRVKLEHGGNGELEFEVRLDRVPDGVVDIAVLGVPFDSGCSFRPGARFGPESIRANSRLIRAYLIAAQQRPLIDRQVADAGDVPCTPFGVELAMKQIFEDCRAKLRVARRLALIGGDHTLSYPAIKAVAEKFGPVVLIHFDSHLDTFPPMYNQDVWHGSPFRKCWEENLLAKDGSTHIGIRASTYSPQDFTDSDAMGIATLTAEDVHERGVHACVEVVRRRYERSGGAPVYLSIDIDVLDPSVAPGTGTPEFGGLLAHQLLQFIRGLRGLPIVGTDLVEVAPAYDHAGITAMAGANLLVESLALMNSCMDSDGFA